LLDITLTKRGEQTMRKSLWVIAVALSFGSGAFAQENLSLDITAHVQDAGDKAGMDSQWLGTTGKRLELIKIKKHAGPKNVKIQYRCVIKDSGETAWMDEGKDCGTRGQSKGLLGCVPPFTQGVIGHEIGLVLGRELRPLVHDHP
jgi:hypothetical protein